MNYSLIKKYDIANAKGINTSIFFCGCTHHCQGCFNASIWDFKCGKLFDNDAKQLLTRYLSDDEVKGLSILGGEPLQQGKELYDLIQEIETLFPDKKIWLWTGYYLNELNNEQMEIVKLCDYVIDGRFEKDKTDGRIILRGSTNQTIWHNENRTGNFVKSKYNYFKVE